ncbi:MAG: polysaccharide deacetylase family protein [Deferrisomatales bacterium]|nr:polysaccharide deacetylase family protein [Deferrisomatales bacterium]
MNPSVYLTFDVECSMGGAWQNPALQPIPPHRGMLGRYGDKAYGVPLICDLLDRYGLQATFFVEPFNDELGHPGETEPVCRYLVGRGQDVQLHVHPNHVHYGLHREGKPHPRTDQMADLPRQRQAEILADGAERLERWTGTRPIAFRAGNMGASEETLRALEEAGLWLDSSYTFPYVGGQCRFEETERYNGCKWYGEVLEVALSGFRLPNLPGLHAAQPLDLMGASAPECREVTRMICDAGGDAVAILHSFSLFKWRDVQYNGGRPNRVVIRRFEQYCAWLAQNRDAYPARTFAELGRLVKEEGYQPKAVEPCTLNRPLRALTRRAVQMVNNWYWF